MTYYRKVEYVRCGECGFRKENTHDMGPHMGAGDYCLRCGTQLTEYNELQRQSYALAGSRSRPEPSQRSPWRELAAQAISLGITVGAVYALMRWFLFPKDATITINGDTVPLFDPGMMNSVFAVVLIATLIVLAIPYLPGMVQGGRAA